MNASPSIEYLEEIDNPGDPRRPSRLCVCFSDIHCTDRTVGQQSSDDVVWLEVFTRIRRLCHEHGIEQLYLVLDGDIADMIRTAVWTDPGASGRRPSSESQSVYPWQREHPEFKTRLRWIMEGIIRHHASPPEGREKQGGFFHHLVETRKSLENEGTSVRVLPLLGNHDKEILADTDTLRLFYERCLGMKPERIDPDYRDWVGRQYGRDFSDPASLPWLPFYWADRGFRIFATHGQWRDPDNHRAISKQGNRPGWNNRDGWQPETWREMDYRPFTAPCFGDTVAAGVLSGFIWKTKQRLDTLQTTSPPLTLQKEIDRIRKILDELDLYRPSYAAIARILKEVKRLRRSGDDSEAKAIIDILETGLYEAISGWLSWPFTYASVSVGRGIFLRLARFIITTRRLAGPMKLRGIYLLVRLLHLMRQWFQHDEGPSRRQITKFPAFLPNYRDQGFRLHIEGHTHIPLQMDLDLDEAKNRTYINLGTWRHRILKKKIGSYRRRGVGRMLCILDLPDSQGRRFAYWVQDFIRWGSQLDQL